MLTRAISRLRYLSLSTAVHYPNQMCIATTTATTTVLPRSYIRNLTSSSSSSDKPPSSKTTEPLSTGDVTSKKSSAGDDMFSEDVVKDLTPTEVTRLQITYGLLQDHINAIKSNVAQVDPTSNPLLDPRSFEIKRLPRIPNEVLQHFRDELPAGIAEDTKPVTTKEIWDTLSSANKRHHELVQESAISAAEWDRIDQRTMTKQALLRRNRTSISPLSSSITDNKTSSSASSNITFAPPSPAPKKRNIVLRDECGKIDVDLRAVDTLTMFLTERGKIIPRRKSLLSAKSQRKLSKAIKRARQMALIHPAPKGPTLAELAKNHTPEELDIYSW